MRILMLAALAALAIPSMSTAQTAPAADTVCANGDIVRARLSKLKPGMTMADFEAASAAHVAWYTKRDYQIDMRIAPVLVYADGKIMVSQDEVMTFATGDSVPRGKQDAEWGAYVDMYRKASDLGLEKAVCMPKRG